MNTFHEGKAGRCSNSAIRLSIKCTGSFLRSGVRGVYKEHREIGDSSQATCGRQSSLRAWHFSFASQVLRVPRTSKDVATSGLEILRGRGRDSCVQETHSPRGVGAMPEDMNLRHELSKEVE